MVYLLPRPVRYRKYNYESLVLVLGSYIVVDLLPSFSVSTPVAILITILQARLAKGTYAFIRGKLVREIQVLTGIRTQDPLLTRS